MSASFTNRTRRPSDPPVTVFDITPNDGADLERTTTAINVGTPGKVRVTTVDGTTTDIEVRDGESFPICVKRVWLTGTTATGIRGLA